MTANSELPLEIDVQSVQQLLEQGAPLLLLDVREPDEYDTARITGAKLVPMKQIPSSLDELKTHPGRIVVHCHHGGRSMRVVQWLKQQGLTNVQNMAGGIDAWSQLVDPTVPRY